MVYLLDEASGTPVRPEPTPIPGDELPHSFPHPGRTRPVVSGHDRSPAFLKARCLCIPSVPLQPALAGKGQLRARSSHLHLQTRQPRATSARQITQSRLPRHLPSDKVAEDKPRKLHTHLSSSAVTLTRQNNHAKHSLRRAMVTVTAAAAPGDRVLVLGYNKRRGRECGGAALPISIDPMAAPGEAASRRVIGLSAQRHRRSHTNISYYCVAPPNLVIVPAVAERALTMSTQWLFKDRRLSLLVYADGSAQPGPNTSVWVGRAC